MISMIFLHYQDFSKQNGFSNYIYLIFISFDFQSKIFKKRTQISSICRKPKTKSNSQREVEENTCWQEEETGRNGKKETRKEGSTRSWKVGYLSDSILIWLIVLKNVFFRKFISKINEIQY